MVESLENSGETRLVVSPHLQSGAQHLASRVVTMDGVAAPVPSFAKWVKLLGGWDDGSPQAARDDLTVLRECLGGDIAVAQTKVLDQVAISLEGSSKPAFHPPYALVQDAVEGSEVAESDLVVVPGMCEKIRSAVLKSWRMYREEGQAVDLAGFDAVKDVAGMPLNGLRRWLPGVGLRQLRMHNLRKGIDGEGNTEPVLIDTRLLKPSRAPLLVRPVVDAIVQVQYQGFQRLVNAYLKPDDRIELEGGNKVLSDLAQIFYDFTRRFQAVGVP